MKLAKEHRLTPEGRKLLKARISDDRDELRPNARGEHS